MAMEMPKLSQSLRRQVLVKWSLQYANRGKLMKRLIVGLLALACAGCVPPAKVDMPDAAKSASLPVSDMRPASEKDKKIFSLLLTSKEYGVIRTGDTGLSPSPVTVLQYDAFHKLGGADHKVTVYHFVIYINAKAHLRAQAVFAGIGGIIGGMISNSVYNHSTSPETQLVNQSTFDNVSGDNEYERAYYTRDEDPSNSPVYIIYLDTDIDGKRLFTRTVTPMRQQGKENSLAAGVELAITNHLNDYASGGMPAPDAVTGSETQDLSTQHATVAPIASATSTTSVQPTQPIQPTQPVPAPAVAPVQQQTAAADVAMTSKAQEVATGLGCGIVQSSGNSGYIAPCGDHGVYIDCDDGACRPMHTVNMKGNE
jgi:hypothetical protein